MGLTAKNLHKSFCDPAPLAILRGVSLDVQPGETVAIRGQSGEGKSTLLHILGTLEGADQGEITIAGQAVTSRNRALIRNQHIGFVFQSFHLFNDMTVMENVMMPAQIARVPISIAAAEKLIEAVGLSERKDHLAKNLSGGEKQRVAIARAFCNDPDLILADEPSGNLDSETSEIIHKLLLSFARKRRKAVVIVTHNEHLASLCDRVLILKSGQLISCP